MNIQLGKTPLFHHSLVAPRIEELLIVVCGSYFRCPSGQGTLALWCP